MMWPPPLPPHTAAPSLALSVPTRCYHCEHPTRSCSLSKREECAGKLSRRGNSEWNMLPGTGRRSPVCESILCLYLSSVCLMIVSIVPLCSVFGVLWGAVKVGCCSAGQWGSQACVCVCEENTPPASLGWGGVITMPIKCWGGMLLFLFNISLVFHI